MLLRTLVFLTGRSGIGEQSSELVESENADDDVETAIGRGGAGVFITRRRGVNSGDEGR